MGDLLETTDSNSEAEVLKNDVICCVYLNAAWCKEGVEMTETLKSATDEVGDKMKFCEVDTDKQARIVQTLNFVTIPTLHFVKDGESVDKLRGKVSKLDLPGKISAVLSSQGDGGSETSTEPDASESPETAETATE